MLGFKRSELIFVVIILAVVAGVTKINLIDSYRKSRDVTRKDGLSDVVNRLEKFKENLGYYPPSTSNGQIEGCDGFLPPGKTWQFHPCNWGENPVNSPFFDKLPVDPRASDGYSFYYVSTGESYQLLVPLEGRREDEYDANIAEREIRCGSALCTAGRTNLSKNTLASPLPSPSK